MPNMTLSYRQFPAGNVLLDMGVIPVNSGAAVSLSAFPSFTDADGTFGFIFWDTEVSIGSDPAVSFTAPGGDFAVDAWYVPEGGPGGGGPGVSATAFSVNEHKVIPGTPIAAVTPAGAWSGAPSTTVSTTTSSDPVAITALAKMVPEGLFLRWLQFGNGTFSGAVLTVPPNGASEAIAFYAIPDPDPCQPIRDQMDNLSPGDFPTPAAYRAALEALGRQLRKCEEKYGELP